MPLKVTFELSDRDLRYFRKMMDEIASRASGTSEDDIIAQSASLLSELPKDTPGFIRDRGERLEQMVRMLTDSEWKLEEVYMDRVPRKGLEDDVVGTLKSGGLLGAQPSGWRSWSLRAAAAAVFFLSGWGSARMTPSSTNDSPESVGAPHTMLLLWEGPEFRSEE